MKEKVKHYEKTLAEGDEQVSNLECKISKLENDLKHKGMNFFPNLFIET